MSILSLLITPCVVYYKCSIFFSSPLLAISYTDKLYHNMYYWQYFVTWMWTGGDEAPFVDVWIVALDLVIGAASSVATVSTNDVDNLM